MEGNNASLRIVLILCAVVIGRVRGEYDDEVWRRRSEEAKKAAQEAYHPDPLQVTADFNHQVHLAMEGISNTTRRDLLAGRQQKHKHACMATNPTDQCWRCDPNWANNRKKLANCAIGFGRGTTGGKAGEIYVVTDPSDDNLLKPKPGTLRYAVIQPRPLWIIFARSMFITLTQELMMTSDKTIDGRGVNVHICNGAQITIQFVKNIIIHGIRVHDNKRRSGGMIRDSVNHFGIRTQSDGDGISLFGATNIWIDHVSLSNCDDGLIDAIQGSTAITISNCLLTDHNEVMLFGASDTLEAGDRLMQMTVAFNHFGEGLVQRMPRCRWGFFHVVNNDYTHWHMYAIGGSSAPTIISQGNRFVAPVDRASKEVTKRDYAPRNVWKNWNWRSEGDLLMNGAFFIESGKPTPLPRNHIQAKPGTMAAKLTRFAGALKCVPNRPC